MHHFVTGAAGFIGSHLVDRLLGGGDTVTGVDDLSLGRRAHLASAERNSRFHFQQEDVSNVDAALRAVGAAARRAGKPDILWHLAANSDIAAGAADGSIDFERTLKTTIATLAAARAEGIRDFAFASTSAVYGERQDALTEDSGPMLPISSYGAAKLGSEAFVSAAAESFLGRSWIFRFPNVVGPRATHGAIFDFVRQMAAHPSSLRVLGDGNQAKPYLHVDELLSAMQFIVGRAGQARNVFNIGPASGVTRVSFIAEGVVARTGPGTPIEYTGGDRGWVGDVPRFSYSTRRLADLGWAATLTSDEAVTRAIDEIASDTGS